VTLLRAAREWKVQHGQPQSGKLRIKELSADQVTNPWSPMLQLSARVFRPRQSSGLNLWLPLLLSAFFLARDAPRTPSVRNPNSDAVYDEAARINALWDALHGFHQRWVRAFALYDEVARLMDEAA